MPAPSQRKKSNPKEPSPVPERIQRHFKSLVAQIDAGHLNNAIKTCDKILRLAEDTDAHQTKLALLLHTEQYTRALALVETFNGATEQTTFWHGFGKAYALYRLNREPEACDVVKCVKPKGDHEERGVVHLEAQIEYRRGDYTKSHDLYSRIFDSSPPQSDEQSDSLTNLTASQTHLDFLQAGFLRSLHALPASLTNPLEDAPPPPLPSLHPSLTTVPTRPQSGSAPETKRFRASRVPKGVTPGVTPSPDPERWLKKSERTSLLHHSGKRRKGATGGATQGSLVEGTPKSGGSKTKKKK